MSNQIPDSFRVRMQQLGFEDATSLNMEQSPIIDLDRLQVERISDRRVPFTQERAIDYLNLPIYEGERPVDDRHCQFLHGEMKASRFNWDLIILAKCELQGTTYKINGQHTSWARLGVDQLNPDPVIREIHYRARDVAQLKAIYSTFDRGKSRSNPHLSKLEMMGTRAAEGLAHNTLVRMMPAVKFWRFPSDYGKIGPAELAQIIERDHAELFNSVGRFFQSLGRDNLIKSRIQKMAVLAAMLETFDRHPEESPTFWRDTILGTNLEREDARWHLLHYLDGVALNQRGTNRQKRVVGSEEIYRICLNAWNRWRAGDKVQSLRTTQNRVHAA